MSDKTVRPTVHEKHELGGEEREVRPSPVTSNPARAGNIWSDKTVRPTLSDLRCPAYKLPFGEGEDEGKVLGGYTHSAVVIEGSSEHSTFGDMGELCADEVVAVKFGRNVAVSDGS